MFELDPWLIDKGVELCEEFGVFFVSDRNGSFDTVEDPAQEFFLGGPGSFFDKLFDGDGMGKMAVCKVGRGENIIDGMEEGSCDVNDFVVGVGLEHWSKVVNVDFDEFVDVMRRQFGVVEEGSRFWIHV